MSLLGDNGDWTTQAIDDRQIHHNNLNLDLFLLSQYISTSLPTHEMQTDKKTGESFKINFKLHSN
jgi:hypothetical protein